MIDIAVIGAGNRARKYLSCLPEGVRVCALVEPDPLRREQTARRYGVPETGCYASAEEFFAAPHTLDAVIITAPDRLHVPLAIQAVRRGWHVLLEKPAALYEMEYRRLLDAASAAGVHVAVCLEMNFHPYFQRIRELATTLGPILSIDHTEHIGPDRMAHTFVRGLWSRCEEAGPIFLSKCCHDADFLLSLLPGGRIIYIRSAGSIEKFRPECAPEGAAERCIDCPLRDCPYSAVALYRERKEWIDGFDTPDSGTLAEVIDSELRSGRYGRCVYRCDNNVFDNQEVLATVVLPDGNSVALHLRLEGTSMAEGRSIVISGPEGTLFADGGRIVLRLHGREAITEDYSHLAALPLHAGADRLLVEDFFDALRSGREPATTLSSAFAGHCLCYLAG